MQPSCTALALLSLLLAAGCAPVVATAPPADVRAVVVFAADNRTGSELYADAPPLLSLLRDAPAPRVTVPQLLALELRRQLAAQGFAVLEPGAVAAADGTVRSADDAARHVHDAKVDAHALYTRLSRWEPDEPSHVTYVDVEVELVLASSDGGVVWQARWPARPVDGGGDGSVALAYPQVARRVVASLLAHLEQPTRGR